MTSFTPHLGILPPAQRALWNRVGEIPRWFTLYGGTALALRLGHRNSVDFDFFTSETFTEPELRSTVSWLRDAQVTQRGENTLAVLVAPNEVRVSFFGGLTLRRVASPDYDADHTVLVASIQDLVATKLAVITQRAALRDYIDIAAILQSGVDLSDALGWAKAVYRHEFDPILGLKALSYFGDVPELAVETRDFLTRAAAGVRSIRDHQPVSERITPSELRKGNAG